MAPELLADIADGNGDAALGRVDQNGSTLQYGGKVAATFAVQPPGGRLTSFNLCRDRHRFIPFSVCCSAPIERKLPRVHCPGGLVSSTPERGRGQGVQVWRRLPGLLSAVAFVVLLV